jgi:hypothetical protein
MSALKNIFLEEGMGQLDAPSGLGRMVPSSVMAKKFINRGS